MLSSGMLRHVAVIRTEVSEKCIFFMVKIIARVVNYC
jgi:hypothetical protein